MAINQDDFITSITGNVVIQNNGARLVLQANADLNTLFEGDESFKLVLRKGSAIGPVVATTSVIIIRDTSNTITYDSLVESTSTISESGTVSFVLDTTNLGPNNTLYYNTVGNVTSSLFASGNTGSFITTGNAYTLALQTTDTIPDNETRFFQLEIREGSLSGPVKITSNVITVVDALQAFVQATGGRVLIEDGYKIHVFNSSNTFAVSGLGLPSLRDIEYLVVAGGGGSVPGGSGAGAGGFRTGNLNLSQTSNYTVTVGSGGTNGGAPGIGNNGNPSVLGNPGTPLFIESAGGGRGVSQQYAGSGGSGGGGSSNPVAPATQLGGSGNSPPVSPPQGFPGGNGSPGNGGGGGAGAAGGNAPGPAAGGIGRSINWATPAFVTFGTSGPTPGRWFAGGGGAGPTGTGGAGGGNAGPTAVNTGGGGRGDTNPGAPGIVLVRYPYTVKTFNLTDDIFQPGAIVQGSNITYTLTTINVSNGNLYYTTSGNVTTSDFFGGNTGAFLLANANATFSISIANNIVSGGDTKVFTLQLREGSTTGPIVASANTVTIYSQDSSNYIQATGGTIIDSSGYRLHVFTSADDFNVSSVGTFNQVEYLIVAGGGGGTGASGTFEYGGAGGGAGGLLTGITTVVAQPYVANIGGGGAGGAGNFPNPVGIVGAGGSNSSIFGLVSIGGGRGGSGFGGSGGGSVEIMMSPGQVTTAGVGVPGQGFPGGRVTSASNPGGVSSAGGGAGAAGKGFGNGPVAGGIGKPISWIPNSYGAGGPAPGRWFAGGGAGGNINPAGPIQGALGGAGGGGASAGPEGWPLGGPSAVGQSGNVNTGGGGAGGTYVPARGPTNPHGGGGGSGVIIIRYLKP